jgi:hypothetical protein
MVVSCRENQTHRITRELDTPYGCLYDILPSFWANYGYDMGIKPVFNDNSKMLKVPTPNSNLNLFTFTFHYISPTNAQQMHFSPVNKTVCPLECAALTSWTHRTTVVSCCENHVVVVLSKHDTLRTFWARHGYKTGIKLVLNENSKSQPSLPSGQSLKLKL